MSCICINDKTKESELKLRMHKLRQLYDRIPPTCCVETSCADWCCTKLESSKSAGGHFMSLPLIYTIEFFVIADYIENNFSQSDINAMMRPECKSEKCVFRKSGENGGCMIYPVRPYSCRVYGRTVPDYFWGIEYPEGSAKTIDCVNCRPVDSGKEKKFIDRLYKKLWDDLHSWSMDLPVVKPECQDSFKKVTGLNTIFILGWLERNELFAQDAQWFDISFKKWWSIYSELL